MKTIHNTKKDNVNSISSSFEDMAMPSDLHGLDDIVDSNSVDRSTLNKLILNYLIFEGYEDSTLKFAKEIGADLENEEEHNDSSAGIKSIKFRNEIKLNILNGDIEVAINKLNLIYPDLLEKNNFLYFKLLLLNLIEMIRDNVKPENNKVDNEAFIIEIIKFAQEKLTNKAVKNIRFMEELELTMTLLLYSNIETEFELPKKLNELLEFKLRRDISDLVNKAILIKDNNQLIDINYKKRFYEKGGEEEEYEYDFNVDDGYDDFNGLNNQLIDSNLKKMIKLWIWGENQCKKSVLSL